MSEITPILLSDARDALTNRVTLLHSEAQRSQRVLEPSLCFWLEIESLVGETNSLDEFYKSVMEVSTLQDHRQIAALGLGVATYQQREVPVLPGLVDSFSDRLRWQIGCEPRINGRLQPFCSDSLALFGLALGVSTLEESLKNEVVQWLNGFLNESYSRRTIAEWEKVLLSAVSQLLPMKSQLGMPGAAACAESRLILARRTQLVNASTDGDELDLLQNLKAASKDSLGFVASAFQLSAFTAISKEAPVGRPNSWTVENVVSLLEHFPRAMERWTWEDKPMTSKQGAEARRWHVDHEYHVQNLLWAILAPIFPDLESEFYTESIGQKHPRADLGIPSLQLIIEAKFFRASDKPQKIIEEISADASFYRARGSKWKTIVPFIWDDGRRTEAHDTIQQGLSKIEGIAETVIIARPGKMQETGTTPSANSSQAVATVAPQSNSTV